MEQDLFHLLFLLLLLGVKRTINLRIRSQIMRRRDRWPSFSSTRFPRQADRKSIQARPYQCLYNARELNGADNARSRALDSRSPCALLFDNYTPACRCTCRVTYVRGRLVADNNRGYKRLLFSIFHQVFHRRVNRSLPRSKISREEGMD